MSGRVNTKSAEALRNKDTSALPPWREHLLDQRAVVKVPISLLQPCDSPRLAGENKEYIQLLAELEAGALPPIIVHRSTMRVIDGMHRMRAATLRGQEEIEARFYDGNDEDAFVLAVKANVTHGLPLSLGDRTAAAARIIRSHPQLSDRMIAAATGLAGTTVGTIRRCSTEGSMQSNTRVGQDGRVRPVSSAAGRRLANELMNDYPDASLREIAKAAGIAPATVRDVRERVRSGEDPVPPKQRRIERSTKRAARGNSLSRHEGSTKGQVPSIDPAAMLQRLRKDPSLRFNESGRILLRWLDSAITGTTGWERVIENIPAHCAGIIAELAHRKAQEWSEFAKRIDQHRSANANSCEP
jgi:hypothetical protein